MKIMCNCIDKMNADLKKYNTQLDTNISIFNADKPAIVVLGTMKIESKVRRGPARLIATFCPFCGEKYEWAKTPREQEA